MRPRPKRLRGGRSRLWMRRGWRAACCLAAVREWSSSRSGRAARWCSRRAPSWPNRDSLERTTLFESIEIQVVTAAGTFSAPPQNAQYRASSRLMEWQVPQTMPSTTCVPQLGQNCERGATGWPQEGQCMPSSGSFAPQVPQNVASWRFLAPQARQTFDRRSLAPQELQNKSSSRFIRPHDRQSIAPLPSVPADVVPPEERAYT